MALLLRADWHTHASYYRLERRKESATIEAMVRRGAELGLHMMGVGEHVNWNPIHPASCYEQLAADLRRQEWPIPTYLGAELDIVDDGGRLSELGGLFERARPDYLIASVHALPDYATVDQYLALYHKRMVGAIAGSEGADILGHPWHSVGQLVARGLLSEWRFERIPQTMLRELVDALRLRRCALEINRRAIAQFANPAYREFVRDVQRAGVRVAVGSDAHDPKDLAHALPINDFMVEMGFTAEQVWLPARARP